MQVSPATTALIATSIIGAGAAGAALGWGRALQVDGNRGGDMAGALGASVALIGTSFAAIGAAASLAAPKPIAALGVAMLGAGAAASFAAYVATRD